MCEHEGCKFHAIHVYNGKFYCFAHWIEAMQKGLKYG